ncbi:MAG: site-2 protease family protein [Maioricimonas sp. JB049]
MDRQSPLFLAFPIGYWFGVRIRISWLFPLLAVVFWFRFGFSLGSLLFGILFGSVLIHELFHVFGARMTGGSGDDILLWPLGGLATVRTAPNLRSELVTTGAGPFANLLLCLATLPVVHAAGLLGSAANLVTIPYAEMPNNVLQGTLVLIFSLNWKLLWLNLLPAYPLDGGRILQALVATRTDAESAWTLCHRIGIITGIVLAFGGLIFDEVWLVMLGFLIVTLGIQEFYMSQLVERFDDSFMGYDFSQGYTSLERSASDPQSRPPRQGLLQRWKQKRAQERRLREEQERAETVQKLDELLDKVHREGMDSLSPAEKRFLRQASERFRSQDGAQQ